MKRFICFILCLSLMLGVFPAIAQEKSVTGTSMGFGGEITVTLNIQDEKITAWNVDGSQETPGVGGVALDTYNHELFNTLMDQPLTIELADALDTVSGATVTSSAVKSATRDALRQALNLSDEKSALTDLTKTYSVYGNNYSLPFHVQVTIQDGKLDGITVTDVGGETVSILQTAIDRYIPRVLESQSLAVDAVTGATASCAGIRNAVSQAIEEAGGHAEQWMSPMPKSDQTVQLQGYDVIVVGLGASGVASYLSAAENGATVFGMDAAGKVGGASATAGGPMAVNPQNESVRGGKTGDFVDVAAFRQRWLEEANGEAKEDCVDLMLNHSGDTLDWLIEKWGFRFTPVSSFMGDASLVLYASYDGDVTQMYQQALDKAQDMNEKNEVQLELTADTLILSKDGAVAGVRATSYDGTIYEVYAPCVILATGGFGGSLELCTEYYGYPIKLMGMYQNDGAGIRMGTSVGGMLYHESTPSMQHTARAYADLHVEGVSAAHGKALSNFATITSAFAVNAEGNRFCNEAFGMGLGENSKAAGEYYYVLLTQDMVDIVRDEGFQDVNFMLNMQDSSMNMLGASAQMPAMPNPGDSSALPAQGEMESALPEGQASGDPESAQGMPDISAMMAAMGGASGNALQSGDPVTELDTIMEAGVSAGIVIKADTLEELSEKAGMNSLISSVEAWNTCAREQTTDDFGRDGASMKPIADQGPYYLVKACGYSYSSTGGLDVDASIHVLNADSQPIAGLYAVGTDSLGVLLSDEVGYVDYGGVAHGWCFTSGRVAGKNAASEALTLRQR